MGRQQWAAGSRQRSVCVDGPGYVLVHGLNAFLVNAGVAEVQSVVQQPVELFQWRQLWLRLLLIGRASIRVNAVLA